MRGFDVWDIIKVPFPYTNRPVQQYRPALVIGRYNEPDAPQLLWVLMITSASHRRWAGDIEISDQAVAGLPSASIVRGAKIATIQAADSGHIGVLPSPDRAQVRNHVSRRLDGMLGS